MRRKRRAERKRGRERRRVREGRRCGHCLSEADVVCVGLVDVGWSLSDFSLWKVGRAVSGGPTVRLVLLGALNLLGRAAPRPSERLEVSRRPSSARIRRLFPSLGLELPAYAHGINSKSSKNSKRRSSSVTMLCMCIHSRDKRDENDLEFGASI